MLRQRTPEIQAVFRVHCTVQQGATQLPWKLSRISIPFTLTGNALGKNDASEQAGYFLIGSSSLKFLMDMTKLSPVYLTWIFESKLTTCIFIFL